MLCKFDLELHKNQLQEYLIDSLPTTNNLVGWLVGTGYFESDSHGKCVIWTTHPDPLHCKDPVVWIFDSVHRLRLFVSTEVILDQGEFTPEALELAHSGVYKGKEIPTYFANPQLQELYTKSKELLKTAMIYFKENHKTKVKYDDFMLIHGMNSLWDVVLNENFDVVFNAPCFKYIKALSSFDTVIETSLPAGLKLDVLQNSEVTQVKQANKVDYSMEYVADCCRLSSAIRTTDTNELAAWSFTHRDFFVGSLHVMPEHRRKGLAEIVLQDICKKYYNHFKKALPNNTKEIYATATVETFNTPSASLFKKKGWTEFGLGSSWVGYN